MVETSLLLHYPCNILVIFLQHSSLYQPKGTYLLRPFAYKLHTWKVTYIIFFFRTEILDGRCDLPQNQSVFENVPSYDNHWYCSSNTSFDSKRENYSWNHGVTGKLLLANTVDLSISHSSCNIFLAYFLGLTKKSSLFSGKIRQDEIRRLQQPNPRETHNSRFC